MNWDFQRKNGDWSVDYMSTCKMFGFDFFWKGPIARYKQKKWSRILSTLTLPVNPKQACFHDVPPRFTGRFGRMLLISPKGVSFLGARWNAVFTIPQSEAFAISPTPKRKPWKSSFLGEDEWRWVIVTSRCRRGLGWRVMAVCSRVKWTNLYIYVEMDRYIIIVH